LSQDEGADAGHLLNEMPITWLDESEWVIEARQDRSRRTMRRILDAAVRLFVAQGYEATTVARIAHEADIAPGSIYRRFSDKDALLKAVVDSYYRTRLNEFDHLVDTRFAALEDRDSILALYTHVIFSAYRRDRGLIRLVERRSLVDPEIRRTAHDASAHVARRIAWTFSRLTPDADAEALSHRIHQWHHIQRGILVSIILPDGEGDHPALSLDDTAFETDMLRLLGAWVK